VGRVGSSLAGVTLVSDLIGLAEDGAVVGVDEMLRGLDDSHRAEARRWFEGSRRWFRDHWIRRSPDGGLAVVWRVRWVEAVCAVSLLGPVAAARRVPWRDLRGGHDEPGEAILVRRLREADRAWVAGFVQAASEVRLGADRWVAHTLAGVLRGAVTHHGLPCPTGATFLREWLFGTPVEMPAYGRVEPEQLVAALRVDPLMPELLLHYLGSGHCGDSPGLPEASRMLVAEGSLDRGRLLEAVLAQLTTQQRVASQRVLAEVLRVNGLTAAEVAGGLTYLLGVLSTADGSVCRVVVPLALELVMDSDGLGELVAVLVARPERKPKELLLRALRQARLGAVAGHGAVIDALRVLAGDDDAAFATQALRALAALGEIPSADEASAPLGLWSLEPQPVPAPERRPWARRNMREVVQQLLSAPEGLHAGDEAWATAELLHRVATGRQDPTGVGVVMGTLLGMGTLKMPRATRLFEDLFLGGVMRSTWPVALGVADFACSLPRRPPRLEVLLRMLAGYAAEAPPLEPPAHLRALAASSGDTKVLQEARRLGAALCREPVPAYVARVRADSAAAPEPIYRGLWQAHRPQPLLGSQRLPDAGDVALDTLVETLAAEQTAYYSSLRTWMDLEHRGRTRPIDLTRSDLLLDNVVRAAAKHGVDVVRRRLGEARALRSWGEPGPVGFALELWAARGLTLPVFWKLALRSRTRAQVLEALRGQPDPGDQRWSEVYRRAEDLIAQAQVEDPILPTTLDGAAGRLTFLRTCESLLRLERQPVLLSTPTYGDGTLDFDDLLPRLAAAGPGGAGPLDVLQALHRLRPTEPERAAELELPPVATVPELSHPDGRDSWDAVAVVRAWVAAGGIREQTTRPSADGERWEFHAEEPVPWSLAASAPADLYTDRLEHNAGAVARVVPTWPERLLDGRAFGDECAGTAFVAVFARLSGKFDLAAHNLVVGLTLKLDEPPAAVVACLADLHGHGRLDPALLREAAAGRCAAGTLDLRRAMRSWRAIIEHGGLSVLWPIVMDVLPPLCAAKPPPAGLPDLLRAVTFYAHEVPEPAIPNSVALAESGYVEARELVAALTAARPAARA
jgi:hypothetical protein